MSERPVALVVGGGSGIGADSARALAAEGFEVGVMSSSGKGQALGDELGGLGIPTSSVFRAGLAGYTKLFSTRYADRGVRMNNVLPGVIDSLPPTDSRVARIPAGRYGRVEELSDVITLLISDRSSYVTGQNLRVDGGLTHSV